MAVLAEIGALHDLHAAAGKVGAVALLHAEAKGRIKRLTHGEGLVRIGGIHANMSDLKAERDPARLLAEARDLIKIVRGNVRLGAQPAAADRMDKRGGDVFGEVLVVHAAGGDKLDAAERAGECLHDRQATVDVRREELHDLQAAGHGLHDLGRCHTAGRYADAVLDTPDHDLLVEAGGDDELCAARDGILALLERDDRARTHEHIGALLCDRLDGVGGCRRAEGDLHHVHAARKQRLCGRHRIRRVVEHDDRHHRRVIKSF